ncbi:alpha/beta fold hydrolase [Rhodococcus coprophilus]|uniref:2-hydroxy-6-oxo-6-phenylhexa-2,4-dienoate hydrolase n=1 Tax=Rhodococcus coprophilus TaxID=38310 RepID=A0A2X4X3T3_9NOCA|nr:alpha/beta hydrolase [Rhodococcus coprophilus]MBM7458907.1 2-hydroxymuconate-semialdehyde hydrolase [Rhodococcus coprophilus]SQI34075.1 2-hydroxy-6-oxo-6-phenylhexa-2,4-dienoate hydrolase [Rhodococcus coprophilus]
MNTITTRDVQAEAWRLNVLEAGDTEAPAILWLHGSGPGVSARSNWAELVETMPDYHHIAPDVLGFADSEHPEDLPAGVGASSVTRVDSLFALLDALDVHKTHVVGNSLGGMLAMLMLQRKPERFDRVILMGSAGAPLPPSENLIKMVLYYTNESPDAMENLLQHFMHDTSSFGDTLREVAKERAEFAARSDIRRSHERTFTPEPTPLFFTAEQLGEVDHEVLVVHGREDSIISVDASYYYAKHLPNAQLHVLPHAGHWVQIEQASRFRALAELFLSEGASATGGQA